jgi:hypothetical protein
VSRLSRLKQWASSASLREAQASRRYDRLCEEYEKRAEELSRELDAYQNRLELQGMGYSALRQEVEKREVLINAEINLLRAKQEKAYKQCNDEFRKQESYCKEQREVLRALEDLDAKERSMYELDNRKDQVMTVFKVALANLAMRVRDQYFPASYANATWLRLLPFFRFSDFQGPLPAMRLRCWSSYALSMIVLLIGISQSSVNGSLRLPQRFLMDAVSVLLSIWLVAVFLRQTRK